MKKNIKVFRPNNFKKGEAQLKTHDKTQENKETLVAGNIFMKTHPKKGLACLLPNDWLSIYKSQVRSLSYQKRNRIWGKKRKREQICSSSSHPNPLFQISRVGMEDPFPKSKRRQRIEHIWAQNYSMNPQATMMEVKKPCSPLRSTGFLFVSDVQIHS